MGSETPIEGLIVVITTSNDLDELDRIADRLISDRLAACCQINSSPIASIYHWDGQVERDTEFECRIKTLSSKFDAVADTIKQMHHYDVPQLFALPATHCDDAYRSWVQKNCDQGQLP